MVQLSDQLGSVGEHSTYHFHMIQLYDYRVIHQVWTLGWVGMFHHSAWAVGS